MGWLVSYVEYDEIVASGVQTCSAVINDVSKPLVVANDFVTLSTPPSVLAHFYDEGT